MKFFLGRFGMQIITNQFQKELKQHGNEQFPFLVSYQKLSEYESGSFMWHWHPEIEITYVQKGTMCYKVNHMVYHLKEGDIVFNNSGALHSGTMENQKDCAYIPVTFDSRLIYGFFQSTVNSKYVDPVIQDSMLPAICIDQSEPWHKPFREYLLRIIDLDEKKPDFYELDYSQVSALSFEVRQKLNKHRPETLGQASRLSGVTPAAISLLLIHLKKGRFKGFTDMPAEAGTPA